MSKRLTVSGCLAVLGSLFLASGCAYDYGYGRAGTGVSANAGRQQYDSQVSTQLARTRADLQQIAEAQRKFAAHIEELRAQLAVVRRDLRTVQQQTTAGGSEGRESLASISRRLEALQNAIESEKRAREAADKEIISSVSREVSTMIEREVPSSGGGSRSGIQARGSYTVKRGDTLSAIAQAFGVRVSEIKQLNNLQSDLIREGQKLLIPQE